ncbi:Polysaccharide biosynthesis protein CapD-type [Erythrobacter litoralis HTCC2594]|uniref:Polysaccharide biosynthesis protein CapD-type n=1 Tax=Erythrobacter litoralis (strain HTCC2594) TaxID=314225 RepID=Q2N6C5_ERYLH|nr:Polysaccharide biosynthesis protein CapD-type [Erythrobacter litoralis HTCC2594]
MKSSGIRKTGEFLEKRLVRILRWAVNLNRFAKLVAVLTVDLALCVAAVIIAFSLRFGEWEFWSGAIQSVVVVAVALWLPIFYLAGIYRTVVRFIGTRTLMGIAVSCGLMAVGLAFAFTLNSTPGIPRTVAFIQPLMFALLLVFSRLLARYFLFDLLNQYHKSGPRSRVLIYGAGSAGRQLALSLRHEPAMHLAGYIDDDDRLARKHVDGVRVHPPTGLEDLIHDLEIDTVLLALPRIGRKQREMIVRQFEGISVRVLTLPAMGDLIDGRVSVGDLREIEISDLLGRDPVPPNHLLLHKTIQDKVVMVTGAGGSIGSELCRQVSQLKPEVLILVEMAEHALYLIETELRGLQESGDIDPSIAIVTELCNVSNTDQVKRIMQRWRPGTVFHAAAYKHVPLVEDNVISGMTNNIFGTLNCARAAADAGVAHFILISTDKAVRPTNVMGASKRVCELILQALAANGSETLFAIVRFGNVLGSSGSVVPRFKEQIKNGGPITLTHREITRYFMTIPEASQLVIQAGAMAEGGEVYVLDMGEPVKIYDLAKTMINLSGLSVKDAEHPDGDIEIIEVGLRKGEKLYEELLIGNSPKPTRHQRIMQAREVMLPWPELEPQLAELRKLLSGGNRSEALHILRALVPEYTAPATDSHRAA